MHSQSESIEKNYKHCMTYQSVSVKDAEAGPP